MAKKEIKLLVNAKKKRVKCLIKDSPRGLMWCQKKGQKLNSKRHKEKNKSKVQT